MSRKNGVRRLALHRETVRELSQPELERVAGGADQASLVTCPTWTPSCNCTGYYPSLNAPCTD